MPICPTQNPTIVIQGLLRMLRVAATVRRYCHVTDRVTDLLPQQFYTIYIYPLPYLYPLPLRVSLYLYPLPLLNVGKTALWLRQWCNRRATTIQCRVVAFRNFTARHVA